MSQLNDPRVLFAAERTLLAWNRTSLTLMAFGFVIERSGLLLRMLSPSPIGLLDDGLAFWIGLAFIGLGAITAGAAIIQYRTVLRSLKPAEIPEGYRVTVGLYVTALVALLGLALMVHLLYGAVPR